MRSLEDCPHFRKECPVNVCKTVRYLEVVMHVSGVVGVLGVINSRAVVVDLHVAPGYAIQSSQACCMFRYILDDSM